ADPARLAGPGLLRTFSRDLGPVVRTDSSPVWRGRWVAAASALWGSMANSSILTRPMVKSLHSPESLREHHAPARPGACGHEPRTGKSRRERPLLSPAPRTGDGP